MAGLLADPGGPGATPLKIGPVTFRTEELPDKLPLGGGKQKQVSTELVGGGLVVQNFGAQPKPAQWSGTFYGVNVDARVRLLRQMMAGGNEYLVSYKLEQYYCKIAEFQPNYRGNRCDYDITLTITRDANGAFSVAQSTSLDGQVTALMGDTNTQIAALQEMDPVGTEVIQPDVSNLQVAIKNAGPIAQASGTTASSLLQTATKALASANAYLQTLTELSPQYLSATRLVNVLTLISTNIQRGQSTQSIQVQGGTLFEIASMKYGDASLAYALAEANGLPSPFLSSTVLQEIVLPPFAKGSS